MSPTILSILAMFGREGRGEMVETRYLASRNVYIPSGLFIILKTMKVLGAIGLGLTIMILKLLMPDVFYGIEHTLVLFFDVLDGVLTKGQTALSAF